MLKLTAEESFFLQCLSTTALLAELDNNNFLQSDYFNKLNFQNESFKTVMKISGLGNPATMQMMLYALLVIPKEILSISNYSKLKSYAKRINPLVFSLIEQDSHSTYKGEQSKEKIDYFRHIRNAVAHSKCDYSSNGHKNYVIFNDKSCSQHCYIKIECCKVGLILMELQKLLLEYFDEKQKQ